MSALCLGVLGCGGRMGRMVVREVLRTPGTVLGFAADRADSPLIGQDAGLMAAADPCGVMVAPDTGALFDGADAVIDFTTPDATLTHAVHAARTGRALIVGTTGLSTAQELALGEAARRAPIVYAANMSLGVTLLALLVERVARALGPEFDIEIVEMHHRHKVDAPSGTSLALGRAAAAGRGTDLPRAAIYARDGQVGPRPEGAIGFATLRGGSVTGDHTIVFAGEGERIELTHRAEGRQIFARGAVRAAHWAAQPGRGPGLFSMRDVLGL